MNKRKAGEDFYFIHKFTPHGKYSEIKNTRVIPSPRPSHRVPFGTGKAVKETLDQSGKYLTYNPNSFEDLKVFLKMVSDFFEVKQENFEAKFSKIPKGIQEFLNSIKFESKLTEIQANTTNLKTFRSRFFQWF